MRPLIKFVEMKVFLLLVLATAAAVSAVPLVSEGDAEGWFVPTVSGEFEWVSKKQYELESKSIIPNAVTVQYYLYTKSNPTTGKQVYLNDAGSLSSANFNRNHPTRILIHGWQSNHNSGDNVQVRNALLKSGDYNVISVDWSSKAETINYASSRYSVSAVGKKVASFIAFLNAQGMSYSALTVIGHSLGAHVAGFAGKYSGRVEVIIGLDPAFPLFSYSDCSTRLCSTDATFVESIQTNGGTLGFIQPIGKAAFYPNGGKSQPGCGVDLSGSCAHARSWLYYAESILDNDEFPCMKCSSYENAVAKNCGGAYSSVHMGSPASYGSSGTFYVPVKKTPPYGMG